MGRHDFGGLVAFYPVWDAKSLAVFLNNPGKDKVGICGGPLRSYELVDSRKIAGFNRCLKVPVCILVWGI
jgi:hypothetical protein